MIKNISLAKDIKYLEKSGSGIQFPKPAGSPSIENLNGYYHQVIDFAIKSNLNVLETLFLIIKSSDISYQSIQSEENAVDSKIIYQLLENRQDYFNMPKIQKGMANVKSGELVLTNYHEVRIRHFHQTIDKYINGEL